MTDDKKTDRPPLTSGRLAKALQRDRRAFNRLQDQILAASEPALRLREQLARVHGSFDDDLQRLTSVAGLSVADSLISSSALHAAQDMRRFVTEAMPSAKLLEDFATQTLIPAGEWSTAMESYRRALEPLEASRLTFESHFARMAEVSLLANAGLENLDFSRIGAAVGAATEVRNSLQIALAGVSTSYSGLVESFSKAALRIGSFEPLVSGLPPIEHYNSIRLGLVVTDDEIETSEEDEALELRIGNETDSQLAVLLAELDPELHRMWLGAVNALRSSNPDRIRHFATSLRELWGHTVRTIAPDDSIKRWTTDPIRYHNGRPTRKTRLLYVCRDVNHGPFEDFVMKDVDATLEFLQLFQQGTHEVTSSFSEIQLDTMKHRMESALRFVLEIWKKSRS